MSVVVTLCMPASEFELGRILAVEETATVTLESIVPLGERSVPFFRVTGGRERFEAAARDHQSVNTIRLVSEYDGEALYALDWDARKNGFFKRLIATDGSLFEATGTASGWTFDILFPTHESLGAFQEHCVDESISINIQRICNPTKFDAGPWYGLSDPQRETLGRAVEMGYYDIPRRCSAKELADEFDLSDQAVIERLRRGIDNLVTNALFASDEETEG